MNIMIILVLVLDVYVCMCFRYTIDYFNIGNICNNNIYKYYLYFLIELFHN
jgi:hypothetical protein